MHAPHAREPSNAGSEWETFPGIRACWVASPQRTIAGLRAGATKMTRPPLPLQAGGRGAPQVLRALTREMMRVLAVREPLENLPKWGTGRLTEDRYRAAFSPEKDDSSKAKLARCFPSPDGTALLVGNVFMIA